MLNKFKDLYRKKMPTGDLHMLDYIRVAKDIYQEYEKRTDRLDSEPVEDNDNDEYDNDNIDDGDEDVNDVVDY
jgi:hypothetical protein